jgi:hypothetical protein
METQRSQYYPPRAGWDRHIFSAGYALRRRLHLEKLTVPNLAIETTLGRSLLCLALPGFSFCDAGWKWIGRAFAAAWIAAGGVFLVWLGHRTANMAFALMMSLHVSSVLHFLNRAAPGLSVWRRLVLSLAVLFVVGEMVYATGLHWLQDHLFMPLEVRGKICVVNRLAVLGTLHRGEWVAYHSERLGVRGVYIREGYVLDRILAGPGDVVEFNATDFRVNGIAQQKLSFMPADERLVLPEKTWLIWPSLHTVTRNNVSESAISQSVLKMATVRRDQMIGKPFRRWFWRRQSL